MLSPDTAESRQDQQLILYQILSTYSRLTYAIVHDESLYSFMFINRMINLRCGMFNYVLTCQIILKFT